MSRSVTKMIHMCVIQYTQVMYSDKAVVLCAPTGSGKTVLFELAIIRNLIQQQSLPSSHHKAIYSKYTANNTA